jgi:hypothetical protein
MNFVNRFLSYVWHLLVDTINIYISTRVGKTEEWQKLLAGLLPTIFNYLEVPILQSATEALEGSEKFQKAFNMAEKYLAKYVNIEVAKEDLMAYIQEQFFRYKQEKLAGEVKSRRVFIDGTQIMLSEVV